MLPASVRIQVLVDGEVKRSATGVVVRADAAKDGKAARSVVLTNAHVVDPEGLGDVRYRLLLEKKGRIEKQMPARMLALGHVPEMDLALIEVDEVCPQAVPLTKETLVDVGDEVVVVGAPYGRALSVSGGMLSQIESEDDAPNAPVRFKNMKTDAPIGYGSSGGGVFTVPGGELVGLVEGYRTARVANRREDVVRRADAGRDVRGAGDEAAAVHRGPPRQARADRGGRDEDGRGAAIVRFVQSRLNVHGAPSRAPRARFGATSWRRPPTRTQLVGLLGERLLLRGRQLPALRVEELRGIHRDRDPGRVRRDVQPQGPPGLLRVLEGAVDGEALVGDVGARRLVGDAAAAHAVEDPGEHELPAVVRVLEALGEVHLLDLDGAGLRLLGRLAAHEERLHDDAAREGLGRRDAQIRTGLRLLAGLRRRLPVVAQERARVALEDIAPLHTVHLIQAAALKIDC